jgi:hypothetical protein
VPGNIGAQAAAFATAVDTEIAAGAYTATQADCMFSVCLAATSERSFEPTPTDNFASFAAIVVAVFNAALPNLAGTSTPNYVSATNANALNAANPLVWSAPAITRKGSGAMEVSASACPVLGGGGGIIMTFTLWRDYGQPNQYQLQTGGQVITRKILPAGAGQDAEGAIGPFVDVVTDNLPHVYSLVMSNTAAQNMSDGAGHAVITVREL